MDIPHFVYRLFNANDEIIYVGVTGSVGMRMRQHEATKSWWPEVSRMEVEQFPSRVHADRGEKAQIVSFRPRYNTVHVRAELSIKKVSSGRVGRPPSANPRTNPFQIRLTPEQDEYIAEQAAEIGISVSEWVRACMLPVDIY